MNSTRTTADFLRALIDESATAADLATALMRPEERRLLLRCALPRRFNESLVDDVLRPDAGIDKETVPFATLTALPGVVRDSGRPHWYVLEAENRESCERAWLQPSPLSRGESLNEKRFRDLNARIARWFTGRGVEAELEAIYNGLASGRKSAREQFERQFEEAERRFDLARCESLLQLVDEQDRLSRLDPDLAAFRTEARARLRARSAVADDYYRTTRYLQRATLLKAFEDLLMDPGRFILHVHGAGGQGKTMFVRWLAARYCLPKQIPIARVDFDFLDESDAGLEPRFFFGKLAEQLNPQLPNAPFEELLLQVREMRRIATARRASASRGGRAEKPSSARPARSQAEIAEENEVETRFSDILEEYCRGSVVLVFDTLEEARFRHRIDVFAIVKAIDHVRHLITDRAKQTRRTPPRLLVILSGRYPLDEQYPEVLGHAEAALQTVEVTPFDAGESRTYLVKNRELPDTPALDVVIRRAGGSPFKLALYADVLHITPKISRADLERRGDIDLLYLVERVLKRIPDYPMRWVLRYGVLARVLTRQFLEEVLGPHLERAMRGDTKYDDPAIDDVSDADWPALWYAQDKASREGTLDYARLWDRLTQYASASSWITDHAEASDALAFMPVVAHPLRRVLRKKAVFRLVHQDAVAALRKRLAFEDTADVLAGLTYHEFQLDPRSAAKSWIKRLHEYEDDREALKRLASTVLSEDLRETEAGAAASDLITPAVEARALFELGAIAFRDSIAATGEEQQGLLSEARRQLDAFDEIRAHADGAIVPLVVEATLRWNVAQTDKAREGALKTLTEAEKTAMRREDRDRLLLTLQTAFGTIDVKRAELYARRRTKLARNARDAVAYAEAVHALLDYEAARGAVGAAIKTCDAARAALAQNGWLDPVAQLRERGRMRVRLMELQGIAGRYSDALRREDRRRGGAMDPHLLLQRARLLSASDDPELARETAQSAERVMFSRVRGEQSDSAEKAANLMRLDCIEAQARALGQLMEFGPALDLLQTVLVHADELGEHERQIATQLAKARVSIYDVGDLKSGAEHLVDRPDALADETPELQLRHALLRASLHDRNGRAEIVAGAIAQAELLLSALAGPTLGPRIDAAISLLTLKQNDRRLQHLSMLRDTLAQYDCVSARLNRLRGLQHCAPVAGVTDSLCEELRQLTDLDAAGERDGDLHPADHLLLSLRRVELLRVIADGERAKHELERCQQSVRTIAHVYQYRAIALACDRLQVEPGVVLPPKWLRRFSEAAQRYPTLLGACLLEQGEREFRSRSSVEAGRLARDSRKVLERRGVMVTRYNARVLLLLTSVARESGKPQDAREFEANAARIATQLGEPSTAIDAESLTDARADAWLTELARANVFAVEIESPKQLSLRSWSTANPVSGATPRPLVEPLATILQALGTTPLGGSASLPLIDALKSLETSTAGIRLLADALPPALCAAVTRRLRAAAASSSRRPAGGLDLVFAAKQLSLHAVPWELATLDPTQPVPIVCEPNVNQTWRVTSTPSSRARMTWMQRALSIVLGRRIVADGLLGPLTLAAIREGQALLKLAETGHADAETVAALRHAVRDKRSAVQFTTGVLLIRSRRQLQFAVERGSFLQGIDLVQLYEQRSQKVDIIEDPDLDQLSSLLQKNRYRTLHIATPISESRSSGELSLQMGVASSIAGTATPFSASLMARLLTSVAGGGPLPQVIVDVPRPPTFTETLRQLVLRNVFAAQLFALGNLPSVLAAGLGPPDVQRRHAVEMARRGAGFSTPGDLAKTLRNVGREDDLLATAGVALFARDPELDPCDFFIIEAS